MAVVRAALIVLLSLAFLALALPLRWLGRIFGPARFAAWPRLFCRAALALLKVRVVATGRGTGRPRLLVANHVSWIDILALRSLEPLCFLAKREVASWPAIGTFAMSEGTVFVDRRRRRGIPEVNRAMAARLREGRSVLLFPEGTTHDGARRGPFLTSHLACLAAQFAAEPQIGRALAQPVALSYSDPNAAWVGDASLVPHLWSVLKGKPILCRIAFGPSVELDRGYDRKALGRRLAREVEILLAPAAPERPAREAERPRILEPVR